MMKVCVQPALRCTEYQPLWHTPSPGALVRNKLATVQKVVRMSSLADVLLA